jgi:ADP-heptose:LPS heptosyltransferase
MNESVDIVLRFSSLGDIVLCSGFMEKLRRYSKNRIIFGTQSGFRDILAAFNSPPNEVWALPSNSFGVFMKTWDYFSSEHSKKSLSEVRIFDLHAVPKSFFFCFAATLFCWSHGVKISIRKTKKKTVLRWLTVWLKKDFIGNRHVYAEHQKLLAPLNEVLLPKLRSRSRHEAVVQSILVAPDSQHWKKKWPVSHWEDFFKLALTAFPDADFTLVGNAGVFPQDFMDQLVDTFGHRFKNRLGSLPLSDLSLLASEHQLCLCGNSAWQHIAESVGVPVISLPGPIVKGFGFSPFLPASRELEVKLSCRPCTRHGGGVCYRSGEDFHACMRRITPQLLIKNTKEMLSS